MRSSDPLWTQKWSKIRFTPEPLDFSAAIRKAAEANNFMLFGTDDEPGSSSWLASLSEAMDSSFREGMVVLDYGCGGGRYAHFLRQRLQRFEYYGLEMPGSASRHGEKAIEAARNLFRGDLRVSFDLIGSQLETIAIERATVVVLGSVFTHVDWDELQHILRKFQPIVAHGGKVVFSIFIGEAYRCENEGIYGLAKCYNRVWYTLAQIQTLCEENDWAAVEREGFLAQDTNLHQIFALRNKSDPN